MANETLRALRRQVRKALLQAAQHRRLGEAAAADAEQARARRLEAKIRQIVDLATLRRARRRKGAA